MLQLDPMIYAVFQDLMFCGPSTNDVFNPQARKNKFLEAMLESLVPISVTVEHRFLSQVLSIDGCQQPLLKDAPFQPNDDSDYHISEEDFILLRPTFVKGIFVSDVM